MPRERMIDWINDKTVLARMRQRIRGRTTKIARALMGSADLIVNTAIRDHLSGQTFKVRTGRGRGSVTRSLPFQYGDMVFVNISAIHYLVSWERGFRTRTRTIFPRYAKVLKFRTKSGETLYRPSATILGRRFGPRKWFRPSYQAVRGDIRRLLKGTIK